jgi:hypothetical protein
LKHNDVEHNENLQRNNKQQSEYATQNLQENENFGRGHID